jgi:hypothetical protein
MGQSRSCRSIENSSRYDVSPNGWDGRSGFPVSRSSVPIDSQTAPRSGSLGHRGDHAPNNVAEIVAVTPVSRHRTARSLSEHRSAGGCCKWSGNTGPLVCRGRPARTAVAVVLSQFLCHDRARLFSQWSSICQRIELLCRSQSSRGRHLAFANHMHDLNTSEGRSSRPEGLEP